MSDDRAKLRSMADLLRGGATLTSLACPVCSSPLFRLKNGELWCAQDEKKVIVVKDEQSPEEKEAKESLNIIESTLLEKITEINQKIKEETDVDKLRQLSTVLSSLLENLERTRKIEKKGA